VFGVCITVDDVVVYDAVVVITLPIYIRCVVIRGYAIVVVAVITSVVVVVIAVVCYVLILLLLPYIVFSIVVSIVVIVSCACLL